jgi:hypothetical protein
VLAGALQVTQAHLEHLGDLILTSQVGRPIHWAALPEQVGLNLVVVDCSVELRGLRDGRVEIPRGELVVAGNLQVRGCDAAECQQQRRNHDGEGSTPLAS